MLLYIFSNNIKPSTSHTVSAFDLVVTDKPQLVLLFVMHFTIKQLSLFGKICFAKNSNGCCAVFNVGLFESV